MQIQDYIKQYNSLGSEDALFNIPLRKEYLLERIGKGKKILDVGCLGGKLSRFLMDHNNEVWGVEINPVAAEEARKLGIHVKIANVEDGLPFETECFDVINAGEILDHLYDTQLFFRECHRVLRNDGMFLFTAANLNSLENRVRVVMGDYLTRVGAYPDDRFGESIRVFNLSKIRELCLQSGFEIREVRGIPNLESKGKWVDRSLSMVGRVFPHFSPMFMVVARKS